MIRRPPTPTLFPYTTLFRSVSRFTARYSAQVEGGRRRPLAGDNAILGVDCQAGSREDGRENDVAACGATRVEGAQTSARRQRRVEWSDDARLGHEWMEEVEPFTSAVYCVDNGGIWFK